jgi:simple sugar transport system ATP-binding protein
MDKGYMYAVELKNVDKYFGKVQALHNINFQVGNNEIVGLIGDNGAGKSTMIKIITGVFPPSGGDIFVKDNKIDYTKFNVKSAHQTGIETVYQDRSLAEDQDLWRNFFIGRQLVNNFGFIKVKEEKEIVNNILKNMIGFRGAGITVDSKVKKLSGGERQGIAIGRAMHFDAELIILDEPTVALSLKEVTKVLNFVQELKSNGKACIYISHNIHDVFKIADRFVVLDRGKIVASILKNEISLKDLNTFLLDYAHGLKEDA